MGTCPYGCRRVQNVNIIESFGTIPESRAFDRMNNQEQNKISKKSLVVDY
jgi:hypothetical protein